MKLAEQDVSGVTRLSLIAAWLGVLLGGLILILDTMSYEFRTDTPRPEPTVSPSGQDTSLTTPRPTPPSVWKPSPGVEVDNEHGEYMKTLRVDRNALYSGTASARLHQHVEVGKSFPLALAVCGNEQRVCDIAPFAGGLSSGSAPAAPAPAEKAGASKDVPLGAVKVGGRVQVKLTSYGGGRGGGRCGPCRTGDHREERCGRVALVWGQERKQAELPNQCDDPAGRLQCRLVSNSLFQPGC